MGGASGEARAHSELKGNTCHREPPSSNIAIAACDNVLLPDQHLGRNLQFTIEATNHREAEPTFSIEHFVDPIQVSDIGLHIACRESSLLHAKFDGLDGVGKVEREMFGLVQFDERGELLESISFGSPDAGSASTSADTTCNACW